MKNRIEIITFPVFSNFVIHVEVTKDIEKTIRKYPTIADMAHGSDNDADAITVYNGGKYCYIFFHPDATFGTVAHESFHAVESLMKLVGIKMKGETPAYHIGYITERVVAFLRKK